MTNCGKILRPVAFLLISLLIIGLASMVSQSSVAYADQGTVGPLPKQDTSSVDYNHDEEEDETILDVIVDIIEGIF